MSAAVLGAVAEVLPGVAPAAVMRRHSAVGRWAGSLSRQGFWGLAWADARYPARLRERLAHRAPAVLYGLGEPGLLSQRGLTVVGSRDAAPEACDWARSLGARAAAAGLPVISGAARGIDREAMQGALAAGGTAIGILPGELARTSQWPRYQKPLAEGRLLLCSEAPPAARWQTWRALQRNRLLHALGDASVVVHARAGTGGTWQGARAALAAGHVPVWVREGPGVPEGNRELLRAGGQPLNESVLTEPAFAGLFRPPIATQPGLFDG